MLDRTTAPPYNSLEFKSFASPIKFELANGVPIYSFNSGDQQVFKLELIFVTGSAGVNNPAIPGLAMDLLREGSKGHSAEEINELLDYYGAFVDLKAGLDYCVMTLYGRSEFVEKLIPLLAEIITEPTFEEQAIRKQQERNVQNLAINQKKTSYWSTRLLRRSLFGQQHGYGRLISIDDINTIESNQLDKFHVNDLLPSLKSIIIAGSFDDNKMNRLLADWFSTFKTSPDKETAWISEGVGQESVDKQLEQTSQASIAIGKLAIKNTAQDYPTYAFTVKLLGGYFGSRLMKSLREEAGLTYGVHAYIQQLRAGAIMQISADVELNSVDQSIDLIFKEMEKLRNEPIDTQEIELVRNYMLGEYINDSNTVFDFAELQKSLIIQKLPDDYFEAFYGRISALKAEDIKLMANELLDPEQLSIVKVI